MTIDEIKDLIRVVQETGIQELEVQQGDNRVRIRSTAASQDVVVPTVLPVQVAPPSPNAAPPPPPAQESPAAPVAPATPPDEQDTIVKSPIVGTYYDAPSPGAGPFVKVGDRVEPKQVLCIIESMKLMNEIEAEMAGTILAKHVENGRPVEYGESLFTIRSA
ncbi:MAG TPA: acetyl-CoA carboxylase biotin carboxyl carrier protein [Bryobacteraceae bacterium]|jgi:acetyl-CoA carboxylase biotin carboxyl carrier protein